MCPTVLRVGIAPSSILDMLVSEATPIHRVLPSAKPAIEKNRPKPSTSLSGPGAKASTSTHHCIGGTKPSSSPSPIPSTSFPFSFSFPKPNLSNTLLGLTSNPKPSKVIPGLATRKTNVSLKPSMGLSNELTSVSTSSNPLLRSTFWLARFAASVSACRKSKPRPSGEAEGEGTRWKYAAVKACRASVA